MTIVSYLEQLKPLNEQNLQLQSNVHPTDWQNPTPSGRYNLVVVGAGTAGLVTAAGAAGLGAKVALIERGLMGGDCLNVGCVPSKALISAARQAAAIRNAGQFGIQAENCVIDFAEVMQRMRRLRASISHHDSATRFRELGIDVFFGQGRFTGSHTLDVEGQQLHFKKAVIATGARAAELPIPGLQDAGYLTNETLFSLTELPERLLVIGGGPIGCEMAQCFARFGSKVSLVEKAPQILSREDQDAAMVVQDAIRRDGVGLELNAKVLRVETDGSQKVALLEQNGQEKRIVVDQILVGIGRAPNVDGLGLEKAGIQFHTQRGVEVDDRLRTSAPHIYAAGDVCSKYKFTHAADFMARIVIQNALFLGRVKVSSLIIPWCTYTSPELAHVGIHSTEAARQGIQISSYTQKLSAVDRAILDGEDEGFVRIHCRKGSDRILGATIVAAHAGDLIAEVVMAMKQGIGLGKIASVIHPYPTQAEAIRKLGDQYNRTRLTPLVKGLFERWLRWTG
jgi:pyruvate/2-oxoglutarate dehydrogenase complex dihydrolipoamide dehydrogenase (E3) component